jgi:hypothetical protein
MGMKRIKLLSLLFVATLFAQNADATLLPQLPYSSHYQGRSYFSDANVTGYVDFAVYDTLTPYGNEWTFTALGTGQYIYAYQIFNDAGSSAAIESFTIMNFNDPPPLHFLIGINTMSSRDPWQDYPLPPPGGVAPTSTGVNPTETRATWFFQGPPTGAILLAGKDSWFLIFSSDRDWTPGNYEMKPVNDEIPTPNPEPCTLALLGLGSTILFAKRKNSVVKMAYAIKSHRVRSHN